MLQKILVTIILLITIPAFAQTYTIERVIDGDTIVVITPKGKIEKIRLIGIDAPESMFNNKTRQDSKRTGQDFRGIIKLGQEATEFVKGLIKSGQEITLESDAQAKDTTGALWGYVFIVAPEGPRGKMPDYATKYSSYQAGNFYLNRFFLNAAIINAGYAIPMTIPPNVRYAGLFKKLYEEAKENKRGLWKRNKMIGNEVSFDEPIEDGASFDEPIEEEASADKDLNWEWIKIGSSANPSLPPYDLVLQEQYVDFMRYCEEHSILCGAMGSEDFTINVRSDQLEKVKHIFKEALAIKPSRWSKLNLNMKIWK